MWETNLGPPEVFFISEVQAIVSFGPEDVKTVMLLQDGEAEALLHKVVSF